MLEYKRIDISEGIDVNKTNLSKECDICHYWYFKNIGFKYEPNLCNGCHDLMQKTWTYKLFLFLGFLCPDNLVNKVEVFLFMLYMWYY